MLYANFVSFFFLFSLSFFSFLSSLFTLSTTLPDLAQLCLPQEDCKFGQGSLLFARFCQPAVSVSVLFSFTALSVLVSVQVFMVMISCGDICKLQYTSTPSPSLFFSVSRVKMGGEGVSSSHFSCQACEIE